MGMFRFELTFIGWQILGILTLGLFNIFYTNPYKIASFTGYYAQLRAEAQKNHIPGAELLHDTYLYEKADTALIASKYQDVIQVMESPAGETDETDRVARFSGRQFRSATFAPPAGTSL